MILNTMDSIMKSPIEECVTHFKSLPKGELTNLTQLFKLQYEQTNNIKNSILLIIEHHNNGGKKMSEEVYKEHTQLVDNLYIALQLIEDRHNVVQEILHSMDLEEQGRLSVVTK